MNSINDDSENWRMTVKEFREFEGFENISEEEAEIHKIEVDKSMFKVSSEFIVGFFIISGILVALYTVFW